MMKLMKLISSHEYCRTHYGQSNVHEMKPNHVIFVGVLVTSHSFLPNVRNYCRNELSRVQKMC